MLVCCRCLTQSQREKKERKAKNNRKRMTIHCDDVGNEDTGLMDELLNALNTGEAFSRKCVLYISDRH